MTLYTLAPNPVFFTIQGEGHLRGFQMVFIRLAGCSVGCPGCDTNYTKNKTMSASNIAEWANSITPEDNRDRWVWITGGEPTDQDLKPLIKKLRDWKFSIALATSGKRRFIPPVDWLSISPHDDKVIQLYGSEVKLVDGLNNLNINSWIKKFPDNKTDFMYRYVQPLSVGNKECSKSLLTCREFLEKHSNWSLSRQDHLYWGIN